MKPTRYCFGPFEFDVGTLELWREHISVHLQSQPARLLAYLIQNNERTVSREELRAAIWGTETYVDFDRSLNFCISQLRAALKDDSGKPVYVRTIPKRGYQFIAAVIPAGARIGERTDDPRVPLTCSIRKWLTAFAVSIVVAAGIIAFAVHRLRHSAYSSLPPVIAIARFDNETGDPALTRLCDALTDDLVERLTTLSKGRYEVAGNARLLRLPREQRDLNAIAASLHAKYIVLGQVQSASTQYRILAHLIRMPDQTHVWVMRTDRTLSSPLNVEVEVAQEIADQFSARVVNGYAEHASSFSVTR